MLKKVLKFVALGLVFSSLIISGCKKEDDSAEISKKELTVPATSIPIINKFTATWCKPCGEWGWEMMDDVIAKYGDKIVVMGTYSSPISKMYHAGAEVLHEQFGQGQFFWPTFTVNGRDISQSTTLDSVKGKTFARCVERVESSIATPPDLQTGYRYEVKDGKINVETRTKFFNDITGEFYLGVYVIEDGVIEEQNTRGPNAVHHNVLRDAKQEFVWGKQIIEGNVTAGTTLDNSFTIPLSEAWNMNNTKVVVIMWNKNPWGFYLFANANNKAQKD